MYTGLCTGTQRQRSVNSFALVSPALVLSHHTVVVAPTSSVFWGCGTRAKRKAAGCKRQSHGNRIWATPGRAVCFRATQHGRTRHCSDLGTDVVKPVEMRAQGPPAQNVSECQWRLLHPCAGDGSEAGELGDHCSGDGGTGGCKGLAYLACIWPAFGPHWPGFGRHSALCTMGRERERSMRQGLAHDRAP